MRTTALFFLLVSTASAQTTLGIPKMAQQQSEWCYITVTAMVANFFGSSIQECTISSHDHPGVDCCSNPSSCNDPGDTSNTLTYWGFPHSETAGPISFNAIKAEIDAHRPVGVGWEGATENHHAVLIDGYWTKSDGSQHLEINNPDPVNVGEKVWVTYDVYLNGGTTDDGSHTWGPHTITKSHTNLHWGPICSYDFFALSTSDYQQCFDQRIHHGQWPSALSSGDGEMAGSFRNSSNEPVASNQSLSGIESYVNARSSTSRPALITVSDSTTYNTILTPSNGVTWKTHYALDAGSFQSTFDTLGGEGYKLVDVYGYNDGDPKFSGTWVLQSGGYIADHAIPASSFKSMDTSNRNAGYMLTRFSTYADANGNDMVAALWLPSTGNGYHWYMHATDSTFQSDYDTMTADGYTLAYTSQQGGYYNMIFTK